MQTSCYVTFRGCRNRISLGSHICCSGDPVFTSQRAIDFLAEGLSSGKRCLLVGPDEFATRLIPYAQRKKINIPAAVQNGDIGRISGAHDGTALLGEVVQYIEGYPGDVTLILGKLGWELPGWPLIDDLLAYEVLVDVAASSFAAIWLCIHHSGTDPSRVLQTHSRLLLHDRIVPNPSHRVAQGFLEELRSSQ
ncbi:MAG: MEDS domain-containing protein [Candidatus Korobacteraceae bacterium]